MLRSLHLEKRDNKCIISYSALVGLPRGGLAFGQIPLGAELVVCIRIFKASVSGSDTRVLYI